MKFASVDARRGSVWLPFCSSALNQGLDSLRFFLANFAMRPIDPLRSAGYVYGKETPDLSAPISTLPRPREVGAPKRNFSIVVIEYRWPEGN